MASSFSASPEPVTFQQPQAVADVPPPATQRILVCHLTKNEKGVCVRGVCVCVVCECAWCVWVWVGAGILERSKG